MRVDALFLFLGLQTVNSLSREVHDAGDLQGALALRDKERPNQSNRFLINLVSSWTNFANGFLMTLYMSNAFLN